jgi:hypothetical protein
MQCDIHRHVLLCHCPLHTGRPKGKIRSCMVSEIEALRNYLLALGQDCRLTPHIRKAVNDLLVALHKAIECIGKANVFTELHN